MELQCFRRMAHPQCPCLRYNYLPCPMEEPLPLMKLHQHLILDDPPTPEESCTLLARFMSELGLTMREAARRVSRCLNVPENTALGWGVERLATLRELKAATMQVLGQENLLFAAEEVWAYLCPGRWVPHLR